MKIYVLDSFALLAYARAEKGALDVRHLLMEGMNERGHVAMSSVNVGEFFYMYYKKSSPTKAAIYWRHLPKMRINVYDATLERTYAAAQLKAQYSTSKNQISFADCYAAALAIELNGILVTGDPEFQVLSHRVNIQFLPRGK